MQLPTPSLLPAALTNQPVTAPAREALSRQAADAVEAYLQRGSTPALESLRADQLFFSQRFRSLFR